MFSLKNKNPRLSLSLKKLLNLGFHLNKKIEPLPFPTQSFNRTNSRWILKNPVHILNQLTLLTKMIVKVLQAGGRLAIINTGPAIRKENKENLTGFTGNYAPLFEDFNVACFEEEWIPGTFTNPIYKNEIPDLVVYISSSEKDKDIIYSETRNLQIPFFNLSQEKYHYSLIHLDLAAHPSKAYLFLQMLLYWIHTSETKQTQFVENVEQTKNFTAANIFSKQEVTAFFKKLRAAQIREFTHLKKSKKIGKSIKNRT